MQVDVGFTIEASDEADLPECILGAAGMNYVDINCFPCIPGEMQQAPDCATMWRGGEKEEGDGGGGNGPPGR